MRGAARNARRWRCVLIGVVLSLTANACVAPQKPKPDQTSYSQTGIASWYGAGLHGQKTSNGEVFDQNKLTAAHRTLPMSTLVEVTNLDNGRHVVVRVNDRGPFAKGRIIDVSRAAARALGFESEGETQVGLRYLGPDKNTKTAETR